MRTFRLSVVGVAFGCFSVLNSLCAHAAIVSVVNAEGNPFFSIVQGTPSIQAFVRITPDSAVNDLQSASIAFSIGDGGGAIGGVDNAPVTAVSFTEAGSIWGAQPLLTSFNPPLPSPSATVANVTLNVANTNASFASNSLLAAFTIDTSALTTTSGVGSNGIFTLNPNAATLTTASRATGGGNSENLLLNFQTATLTVTAIPEPGTIGLLSFAAMTFVLRRSSRKIVVKA